MTDLQSWFLSLFCLVLMPLLSLGVIRKIKARLQNRFGPPVLQPLFNLIKLLNKHETVSADASWIFRGGSIVVAATVVVLACLLPWTSFKPATPGDDIFVVVYLFVAIKFFTVLAALDTGSPFGAFGAEREVLLSMLVEPATVLNLAALAIGAHSTSLGTIFSFSAAGQSVQMSVWLLAGLGLLLCSFVELSRMPIDDPTTHLELTMVHEAMVLENSGPNAALVEFAYAARLVLLYGLSAQCFLHAVCTVYPLGALANAILSLVLIFLLAVLTAVIESVAVKLHWRKNPEFIAYALTMALLASMAALVRGPTV